MRYPLGLVFDSAKHILAGTFRRDPNFAISVALAPLGEDSNNFDGAKHSKAETKAGGTPERAMLSVGECLAALEECSAPVVLICGGEPLEYPEIQTLTREILAQGRHLFLCTDGALIRRRLHMIPPYTNFFWNVKLDGTASVHDGRARRPGVFVEALDGVKAAKNAGFFVVVTTTIYADTNAADLAGMYQLLHGMHVDGYLLAPANLNRSLGKEARAVLQQEMQRRFREVSATLGGYNLMNLPVELEYLRGERELDGCNRGTASYGPRGWSMAGSEQGDDYVQRFVELERKAAARPPHSKMGDAWKMLAWPFGGSLGEKREGAGS